MPFSIVLSPQEREVLERLRIEKGLRSHGAAIKDLIRREAERSQQTKAKGGKRERD